MLVRLFNKRSSVFNMAAQKEKRTNQKMTSLSSMILGCAASTKFNCGRKNPCSPLCIEGQTTYPGNGPSKYVACDSDGGCEMLRCDQGQVYDAEAFECRGRVSDE